MAELAEVVPAFFGPEALPATLAVLCQQNAEAHDQIASTLVCALTCPLQIHLTAVGWQPFRGKALTIPYPSMTARQRQALGYYWPPGKTLGVAPGSAVCYTLLGRVDPHALAAVLNDWLQAQHGQLPQALALGGKAVTDRLAQVVSLVAQETGATVAVAPVPPVPSSPRPT
jgi:hypothetical protein